MEWERSLPIPAHVIYPFDENGCVFAVPIRHVYGICLWSINKIVYFYITIPNVYCSVSREVGMLLYHVP
jgi:hypothetical protein